MTATPPARHTGTSSSGERQHDPRERLTAACLAHRNPHWWLTWGAHSRVYWAYPLFAAPAGTIVSAPDTRALVAGMRKVEAASAARSPAAAWE